MQEKNVVVIIYQAGYSANWVKTQIGLLCIANAEEFAAEDSSDGSIHLETDGHAAMKPMSDNERQRTDEAWLPTVSGQKEAMMGGENTSPQGTVSGPSALATPTQNWRRLYLLFALYDHTFQLMS